MGVGGNVPGNGVMICESRGWILFLQDGDHDRWLSLKLVSKVPRKKANYWLGWSLDERRLAGGKDAVILDKHAPEVFDWVVEVMSERA